MLLKRLTVMALLRCFKPKDGLPDQRGTLSASILPSAIAQTNCKVEKVIGNEKQKWGPSKRYNSTHCAKIGKYTSQHGVAAAAWYFSKNLERV